MIEAYTIGVSLDLDDSITGKLEGVYEQTEQLAGSVDTINTALSATATMIGAAAEEMRALTDAFTNAARAASDLRGASAGMSAGGAAAPDGQGAPRRRRRRPSAHQTPADDDHNDGALQPYVYNGEIITPSQPGMSGLRGRDGPTIDGTGYQVHELPGPPVGPRLPGSGLVPTGGNPGNSGASSPNFMHSDYAPNWESGSTEPEPPADEPFDKPGPIPLVPGKPSGGGHGSVIPGLSELFFAKAGLDAAGNIVAAGYGSFSDPDQQVTQMELRDKRFTKADGDKAIAAAKRIVNENHGMSLIGALKLIQNGYVQTHDLDASIAMAGPLAADAMRLHNVGDDDAVNDIWDLQRSAEVAGMLNNKNKDGSVKVDPFTAWIDNATQIIQADQNVSPHDIWLATQQNDLGAMSASSQGQAEQDIVAGLLGGFKSGTGSAALEREMIGGKMSTGTAKTLEKLGLIDPAGAIKTGQYYTLKPGALKDEKLFAENPVEWFQKDFQPAVDHLSPGDRDALFHDIIAGTGTASGAREAVVDVMQDALIARMLFYAYQAEPNKQQSQTIINANPNTAAAFAGDELGVLANSALNGAASPGVGFLNWVGNEMNSLAQHPIETLLINSLNQAESFGGFLFGGANPFAKPETIGGTNVSYLSDLESKLLGKVEDLLEKILNAMLGQPGKTPSSALFIKPVPGGPSIVQPNTISGHNPGLSPPTPGQVIRVP
jgi:hypothetical protein